jgi:hypothetical protein
MGEKHWKSSPYERGLVLGYGSWHASFRWDLVSKLQKKGLVYRTYHMWEVKGNRVVR